MPIGRPKEKRVAPLPLTPEQAALAADYYPFFRKKVRTVCEMYPRYACELMSDGHECLIESARRFNGEGKFASYLAYKLNFKFRDTLKSSSKYGMTYVPPDVRKIVTEGICGFQEENMAYSPDAIRQMEEKELLERHMRGLTQQQRAICEMVFLREMEQKEVAKVMGLSRNWTHKLLEDAMRCMKQSASMCKSR